MKRKPRKARKSKQGAYRAIARGAKAVTRKAGREARRTATEIARSAEAKRALARARAAVGALGNAAAAAADLVREGVSVARALKEQGVFPPVLLHLVANGEASGQLAAMLERAAGELERKALDALDAGAGEDGDIEADLVGMALMHPPARPGIFTLGVLAHDHPVEIARTDTAQRPLDAGQEAGRADIGVLVEGLADG